MFKLINKNDKNVFSKSMFIKNAAYFQDAVAFFDAYSALCEKNALDLPAYCVLSGGTFSLDGICFFIKTYASEFSFKTIDISIDYLKILYFSIAALSGDGEFVSRDYLINEYLVYKDANAKYKVAAAKKLDQAKQTYQAKKFVFDAKNKQYATNFMWARMTDIFATIVVIFSFLVAVFPVAFYYAERIALKSMIIYAVASLLVGLILRFMLKATSKYLSEQAMEQSYVLQTIKKDKDEFFAAYENIKPEVVKILVENYEFEKGFENIININKLNLNQILEMAKCVKINDNNLKEELFALDKKRQEHIYEVVDKIATASPENVGKLENIYGEILDNDHLKFNNYVRLSFFNKFIDNASKTGKWFLDFGKSKELPFDINAKDIFQEEIAVDGLSDKENNQLILNKFLKIKQARKLNGLNLKNIKDEESYHQLKYDYINSFYEKQTQKKKLPKYFEMKFNLIKTRIVCNSLGELDFLNAKKTMLEYENESIKYVIPQEVQVRIEQKAEETKEYIKSIFECDELRYLGDDEVVCIVNGKTFNGFRFSNI